MTEQISFAIDAAIIDRLGRELVAKQTTALMELVKNAFDADATKCDVVFNGEGDTATLEIRDDGAGMTRNDLLENFMRLASESKVRSPISAKFGRLRAGRKGIGRFSSQRLGKRLTLTTRAKGQGPALRLSVDWDNFVPGRELSAIKSILDTVPWEHRGSGTILRIEGLRDQWTPSQLAQTWRGLVSLQQPFPIAPLIGKDQSDPGFSFNVIRNGDLYEDEKDVINFESEVLDELHAIIEMKVDNEGKASWRISKNKFGDPRAWQRIQLLLDGKAYSKCPTLRDVRLKAYYVILAPDLLSKFVYTRVRDVLSSQGGIRLYRNGFRVAPYGDQDNDWLNLDASYVKRSHLAPIANRNFFGIVEIRDTSGLLFEEHTSREGLIESDAFLELKSLASQVLITAATAIASDRGRKVQAGGKATRAVDTDKQFQAIVASIRAAQDIAQKAETAGDAKAVVKAADQTTRAANKLAAVVEQAKRQYEENEQRVADESAMLRFLATLGMTMAEFSHETGMTFNAFRLDFDAVFEVAIEARRGDKAFQDQCKRAKSMFGRLDSLTAYLNTLAAARAIRGMLPVSLAKSVDDFGRGLFFQARSQNIDLKVETPAYDPLFTRPMHQAEIASVLLNFYTNSVKAMKRTSNARKILIVAERDEQKKIVQVRFSDTGDGISDDMKQNIFDAFFTTQTAPPGSASDVEHATGTGLGLWIVKQIATNSGGAVSVVAPPKGYSTCFKFSLPAESDDAS